MPFQNEWLIAHLIYFLTVYTKEETTLDKLSIFINNLGLQYISRWHGKDLVESLFTHLIMLGLCKEQFPTLQILIMKLLSRLFQM